MLTHARPARDPSDPEAEREYQSIPALLRHLTDELLTLFRQEMALATAEISQALTKLASGVASVAAGAAVLYAGFLTLIAAAVLGLAQTMKPWLAGVVVGAVVTLIGIVLFFAGRKTMDAGNLKPRRTVESLREDKEVVKDALTGKTP
jgi:hypothetical protein